MTVSEMSAAYRSAEEIKSIDCWTTRFLQCLTHLFMTVLDVFERSFGGWPLADMLSVMLALLCITMLIDACPCLKA